MRARHAVAHPPSVPGFEAATEELTELRRRKRELDVVRTPLADRAATLERDAAQARERARSIAARLDAATGAGRELEAMAHERDALVERASCLEDELLDVLVGLEPLDALDAELRTAAIDAHDRAEAASASAVRERDEARRRPGRARRREAVAGRRGAAGAPRPLRGRGEAARRRRRRAARRRAVRRVPRDGARPRSSTSSCTPRTPRPSMRATSAAGCSRADARLVRHGRTEWNRERRLAGRTDVGLDDTGRAQAVAAGRALGRVVELRSSPLSRARETAGLLGTGLDVVVDDAFIELDYGQAEGMRLDDIDAERWRRRERRARDGVARRRVDRRAPGAAWRWRARRCSPARAPARAARTATSWS